MPVTIMLYLFGKPGVELREGEDVTPEELRALGDDLKERLTSAAEVVEKLTGAGWDAQMTLYDILLSHPYIDTEAQAAEKLEELGIDSSRVHIDEWEDEEGEWIEGEEEDPLLNDEPTEGFEDDEPSPEPP